MIRPALSALGLWIVGPALIFSILSGKPQSDFQRFLSNSFSASATPEVEKHRTEIEKVFEKAESYLSATKLQDLRGAIDLIGHKIDKIKNDINGGEAAVYASRIDKLKKQAAAAEDMLVNKAYEILKEKGSDSALFYTSNELRLRGVPDGKISAAEKKILKEGPAIKEAKDKETIARLVQQLENGQKPDASSDRFLLQSAQRIVKMKADSVKAIEDAKNKKELEEQKRQEKARLDQEKKEKKAEEERLAAQKREEEKKRKDEELVEKKRQAEELDRTKQLREAQERARKDSIETARKADAEKDAARKEAARRADEVKLGVGRKAPAASERKPSAQPPEEDEYKGRLEQEKSRKANEQLASQQEELRRMMEQELKEKQRQAQLEDERQNRILQKQQAEQQERARRDSIEAYQKARRDSVEAYRKEQELARQQEKERRRKEKSRGEETASRSDKQSGEGTETDRWGQFGGSGKDQQLEERREKERLAKMVEEERQRKNKREIEDVQRLARLEKARQDSIEAQRRLQEQQENQRRLAEDRKMKAQQERERQLAEEQKRKEEIENQRRIAEERRLAVQQEKERRLQEEQEKRDAQERERRERLAARQESSQRAASAEAAPISSSAKPDMEQDEIQRLLDNVRKEKERLTRLEQQLQQQIMAKQEQRARQQDTRQEATSEDDSKRYKRPSGARTTAQSAVREDPEEQRRIRQNDDERRRQLSALQEKARLDYQKKLDEEKAKLERNRQRWVAARRDNMATMSAGKKGVITVNIDKDAAKYDEPSGEPRQVSLYFTGKSEESPAATSSGELKIEEKKSSVSEPQAPTQTIVKAPAPEDWKTKEKKRRAEKFVADIYRLLERNQVRKARQIFDANRDFIVQYSEIEVSNMVEQTLITVENAAAKAAQSKAAQQQASYEPRSSSPETRPALYETPAQSRPQQASSRPERVVEPKPEPKPVKAEPVVSTSVSWEGNELEYISRINGFVRSGNGKAAYTEFKKVEEQLKNYFTTEEFNHFKSMVEHANKGN
jgi:hypothetical protein